MDLLNTVAHRILCEEFGIENHHMDSRTNRSTEKKIRGFIRTVFGNTHPVSFNEVSGVITLSSGKTTRLVINDNVLICTLIDYDTDFIKKNCKFVCKILLDSIFDSDLFYHINSSTNNLSWLQPSILKEEVIERFDGLKFSSGRLCIDSRDIFTFIDNGVFSANLENIVRLSE